MLGIREKNKGNNVVLIIDLCLSFLVKLTCHPNKIFSLRNLMHNLGV